MKLKQLMACAGLGVTLLTLPLACTEGRPCGGLTGLPCGPLEYCKYTDEFCGAADATGICTVIPEVCTEEYAPVCGCDGETYSNACFAAAEGVSVQREGECEAGGDENPDAVICGTIAGIGCPEGQYCRLTEGQCCCDIAGVCEDIPESCTEQFDPVCGCDGVTYDNACFAAAAGVTVESEGACE